MKNLVKSEFFGVFITLLGGVLWGFSSVCGQYLFTQKGVSADWLVPYRLGLAGLAMVAYYLARSPRLALAPLKDRVLLPQLLIYAFFGLMMTQYSYFCGVELFKRRRRDRDPVLRARAHPCHRLLFGATSA